MRLTYPRPVGPICDWLAVFVTHSSPFQRHKRSGLKALIGRGKKTQKWWKMGNREKLQIDGLQYGAEKRNRVLEKETNVELIERTVEFTEHLVHKASLLLFCLLQLVCCFNASFLCVLIQIMCKHKNMHARWKKRARGHTQQLFSLNLTCVFIKVSSCSIVLRSNGDWLWHNYTNPCMNLVLMEAEHLTQTKCRRADQCWGFFFYPLLAWTTASSLQNRTFTYAMHLL